MYSVDSALVMPYQDNLATLVMTDEFRKIVDESLRDRIYFIRRVGNLAVHTKKKISKEQAALCLENLFYFLDFVACCYASDYRSGKFDPSLLTQERDETESAVYLRATEEKLEEVLKENEALRAELSARGAERRESYVPKPIDVSEFETRKLYIDAALNDVGWVENKNWLNEYEVDGMPNKSGKGFADYALIGDDGLVLAIIEAKRLCKDPAAGRQQAKLYADLIEKKQGRRPVVFLTNGFDFYIVDGRYPERKVAAIYSKRDLEKLFNLRKTRASLKNATVDKKIAGRYYQEEAIKAVCEAFERNRRKALLVMATGSGKTRTVIALVKTLQEKGWIKNFLFLADRTSLVIQAKRNFTNLLPNLSVTNLCEEKDNFNARGVFSTYQTMMSCVDTTVDEEGKLFSCGHFDLLICDEAHRSIYNKYRDIFTYFDAPLVGLTATPKDEVDKNTYEEFELEDGAPTYGYDLAQAVTDGYLVDFQVADVKVKFMRDGISYDELSEEDKAAYEDTFTDEDGNLPESIEPTALNSWLFNEDTIRKVLNVFMEHGLKIDYGAKIGKTIVFAKNHKHAEKILEVFGKEFPHLNGYAKVIDNQTKYSQSAIDEFSDPKKLPQIAISVDMLDTGIDVPEVLNLVFFKTVMSKSKFWQMIGRGTRLCENLVDGNDKEKFYIFDFCENFEFFRMNQGKTETGSSLRIQGALFCLKFEIVYKLQDIQYQTEDLIAFRKSLVEEMAQKVENLPNTFAIRQHLRYVERYSKPESYQTLTYPDVLEVRRELAPVLTPDQDDADALRFDALLYGIELASLAGQNHVRGKRDLRKKVEALAGVANIPAITAQSELIEKILHTDYLDRAEIDDFEHIRKSLRDLIAYIPREGKRYDTNFTDEILEINWEESDLENDDLRNYKEKVEYYVRQHQNSGAIAKLRNNIPLTESDVEELEAILWKELGEKKDYEQTYGEKPLGEFVRGIVGLDMNAAKEAFAEFLNDANLDSRQIYFVNQIVEYVVRNGMMKDVSVMQETPFTDQGSLVEIFANDLSVWKNVLNAIKRINANASTAQ